MKPIIKQTEDYGIFELHASNRDIRGLSRLKSSMKKYGFLPHKAISCYVGMGGKLIVTDGHHRLVAAKELGVPVWYIIANKSDMSIQEEQRTARAWSIKDYLSSYVRNGLSAYIAVEKYVEETGMPLALAISILAGESAGSHNKTGMFKSGKYSISKQNKAEIIKTIIAVMKKKGIKVASNSFFIQALSKVLWVDAFDPSHFISKIKSFGEIFEAQPNVQSYIEEIDRIYNYKTRQKLPLVFFTMEKMRERVSLIGRY